MKIEGQHFLITGASRGIGLAVAEMASREKAFLHLVVRKKDEDLVSKLKKLGAQDVQVWIADLSSRASIESFLKDIKSDLYSEVDKAPINELARQMHIASGADEHLLPINVGLLFFNAPIRDIATKF